MSIELFLRLEYVDFLIRSKSTGKPKVFAEKLNVSERTLFGIINLMKELGAPIVFCKQRGTYYYKDEGCLILHLQKEKKTALLSSAINQQFVRAISFFFFLFNLFIESNVIFWVI